MNSQNHWNSIYQAKSPTEVSWFELEPQISLELIKSVASTSARVIDVGGGASCLVDNLLASGFTDVTVLDISAIALDQAKLRLGPLADRISWLVEDITQTVDIGKFDVCHDRAVFHFLTAAEDRRKYIDLASRSIRAGGHLIMGTFSPDGPQKCSGLDVCRYDAATLSRELGSRFTLVRELLHTHTTPTGKPQQFFFGLFQYAPRLVESDVTPSNASTMATSPEMPALVRARLVQSQLQ